MRTREQSSREKYIDALYAAEDTGLQKIRERLVNADRWGINIGASEGKILQLFAKLIGAKKVVELGTLFGYSSVWIARALPEDGRLYTIERDYDSAKKARQGFEDCGVVDKITLLEGEATEKLRQIEGEGPFDMVFIDANKGSYVEYLEWALQNIRKGGLIIADNVLLGGGVAEAEKPENLSNRQWTEMRRFNEMMADATQLFGTILPTSEGLSVAIRL